MKVRFAPSPTGEMHLGNARTALFNALFARHQAGEFLLRIEDTDLARSKPELVALLQTDLRWLGLEWQEGPGISGPHAPYVQSQRQAIYEQYYQQLVDQKLVYPCFCSDTQLELMRKLQLASGQAPRYSGVCRELTAEQIAERYENGQQATLRFRVPANRIIEFDDLVRGMQRVSSNDIGDFIIRRADKTASFIFCSPLDDALMGINYVLRGDDHLSNTPRQLLLLEALGLTAPQYGHIALILGTDGTPLSKRNGSFSIKQLREDGFLPAAINNYLARLGHYYSQTEWLDEAGLAQHFNVKALSTSPAHFDRNQLLYWQKVGLSQTSAEVLWKWMGSAVAAIVPVAERDTFIATVRHNVVFPVDALQWAETIFQQDTLIYSDTAKASMQQAGAKFFAVAHASLQEHGVNFAAINKALQQELNVKGKALYQPLRLALTGLDHGPEMAPLLSLLGQEKAAARLLQAQQLC